MSWAVIYQIIKFTHFSKQKYNDSSFIAVLLVLDLNLGLMEHRNHAERNS